MFFVAANQQNVSWDSLTVTELYDKGTSKNVKFTEWTYPF